MGGRGDQQRVLEKEMRRKRGVWVKNTATERWVGGWETFFTLISFNRGMQKKAGGSRSFT